MPETSSRWDKVVILKHMFTLQELEEDPAAILEIKEDIRDECSKLGEVTNVVLYDKEPDGVASVRFSNAESAKACIRVSIPMFLDQNPQLITVSPHRLWMVDILTSGDFKLTSRTGMRGSRRRMKRK